MGAKLTPRPTSIPGVMVVDTDRHTDERGAFARLFCTDALRSVVGPRAVVQINHSITRAIGAVRGLHYQSAPDAEMKLIRCVRGKVWDVAVDLRRDSPTFLAWHAEELSPDNARMLVVPEGCAHGFQVLAEHSEMLYLHTAFYRPESEGGVNPSDPAVGVDWPLPITELSARDAALPRLPADYAGLTP